MAFPIAHRPWPIARVKARRRRAFTLIEVLVAIGITALLAGFIIAIVTNVSGFWGRTTGRLSTDAQARYVLDQLTLDLQGALFRDDGNVWLAATVSNNTNNSGLWDTRGATQNLLKPATAAGTTLRYNSPVGISGDTFGPAGTWLRFFTTKRGSNTSVDSASAPVAVGWQIIRRASTNNVRNVDRRYFLHRAEVLPARTLASGFAITASDYTGTNNVSGNTGAMGQPRSVRVPQDVNTIVGENVIDFGIRCYVRDPGGGELVKIFPAANETSHLANRPPRIDAATSQFPEVVDVMVRILTAEGSRLIADFESGKFGATPPTGTTLQAWWWQFALAHSQVFTRRIVLNANRS